MDVHPHIKKAIFLAWILIVPFGIWFTYRAYPPQISGHLIEILAFLILSSVVAATPIVINNIPIFLLQWISLATFLSFGLFVEMIFAQVAIMVVLFKIKIQKEQYFRIPLNSLMFFTQSFVSGVVYYLLGGQIRGDLIGDHRSLWLAFLYVFLNFALNQLLILFNLFAVYKNIGSFFGKDLVWETLTSLITFPVGFILYMLYSQAGLLALLIVGAPFASLSLILNLYYSSGKVNEHLQKAAEIGHQMAERLNIDDVTDLFIQKLGEMLPVDFAYILDVVENKELQVIRRIERGKVMPNDIEPLQKSEGLSGMVWAKKEAAFFRGKKEWNKIISGYFPEDAESVLSVPIVRNNGVVGVLLLASKRKCAYEKSQLMIVDILCSHFAIAIDNARHYEEAKMYSEHCALTKLYNYRYFENMLSTEFDKLHRFERTNLSLIILDLDHFKDVNDTYGHQSGNEILRELANRVRLLVGNKGTVARYGGEEFVILLPDIQKQEALHIAELIRQTIANRPFTLSQHLEVEHLQQRITVTTSIGVATAPENADDSLTLIRHADRALYVGAKRKGRNRVAEYSTV
ncbi:sensor domain-containing diguanylate cyclase [Neobacillus sp. PS3-40]|uniref:sensor domain-containing diguanylate cyclase n=1 Tax=Neobacillus sp. PS3-40 TaxID=3070679 RepID=UPI0027E0626B|nr:sensor domain-containing diguanylate cyclase [Neobacillus sp. PS3-40]WML45562.1 sensor domain-containing diguanylate cyclase [Neobacillus sp. PS3-40]